MLQYCYNIKLCRTICCFQFLSLTICYWISTSKCGQTKSIESCFLTAWLLPQLHILAVWLLHWSISLTKRHVTVSVDRSDCRVHSVFPVPKCTMDLIFHVQTKKNMIPSSVAERSIEPVWLCFCPPTLQAEDVYWSVTKNHSAKLPPPKQIKCIDKTNKLVLDARPNHDISPFSVSVDTAILFNVAGLFSQPLRYRDAEKKYQVARKANLPALRGVNLRFVTTGNIIDFYCLPLCTYFDLVRQDRRRI